MNDVMSIVNLTESDEEIKELTLDRTLAAIPILGRYRVIDFILSNIVNSGIKNVAIFTHGKAKSLTQHLGSGKYWGLDRKKDGIFVFHSEENLSSKFVNKGDLCSFANQLDYLNTSTQEYVLLTKSYMIFNGNFNETFQYHKRENADITILYKPMENSVGRFIGCDSLTLDAENNVLSIGTNLGKQKYYNISMGAYLIKRKVLIKVIEESMHMGDAKNLKESLINRFDNFKVKAFPFYRYISCINSTKNYYLTNMDILNLENAKDLFRKEGKIYTKVMDAPSSKYSEYSDVSNSLIANGCEIHGTVENSVICRGVTVKKGSIVRNSILLPHVTIQETSNLNYAIVDKNTLITEKKMLFGDLSNPFVIKKNSVL